MFEELFQYAKELQEELGNANYKLSRSNWMEGTRTEGYVGEHGSIVNVFVAPQ